MKKLAFVVMFALMSVACFAQNIYSSVSAQTIANLMKQEGYSVVNDNGLIRWKIDGYDTFIAFSDGNKYNNTNFVFRINFDLDEDDIANALVLSNEYHKKWKGGKSYVDQRTDGSYLVSYELMINIHKGVTEANILNFFQLCRFGIETWKEGVVDQL